MPTYVYRREDGTTFEVQQRITEDALTTCPDTGQPVKRVISGNAGLIFKGSGFYLTDYARSGSSPAASNSGASGDASGDGASASAAPTPSGDAASSAKPDAPAKPGSGS